MILARLHPRKTPREPHRLATASVVFARFFHLIERLERPFAPDAPVALEMKARITRLDETATRPPQS